MGWFAVGKLWRIAAVVGFVGLLVGMPLSVSADTTAGVTITATGWSGPAPLPPANFKAIYVNDYEVYLEWDKGFGAACTMIRRSVNSAPTDREDGDLVYYDDAESVTDDGIWVQEDTVVFYTAWSGSECGNESGGYWSTYVRSHVAGEQSVDPLATSLSDIANYVKLVFILGSPLLLGLMGGFRKSLTLYVAGMFGLGLCMPYVLGTFGWTIGIPVTIIIAGLLGGLLRDAFGEGLRVV